ncbi:hypothetical protein DAPPUDRAFT_236360 [Daphnia pulex]|uniref:Uncharacterized protein n=1 Tax=Daphnia pulex TaxID=6669 RepID=E9G1U1_DAPPU|nr:hypothetical protein DAPPUDRAFT_236360 [Daphnia pulex]|eukprot:EFX86554.1 hypothetical protein DAPPUDRAFT_236360 [Daphnia pulex]
MITNSRLNSLHFIMRFQPGTQDARCSAAFDPYTILALLTFGIFLVYLFSIVFNQLAITARGRKIKGVSEKETDMIYSCLLRGQARGGYGGGGNYGGGHGHGSISIDPVSILGLLSLGAVLLRSILTLLPATSARSLDVTDINLPLMLSDIPEAIANWREMESNQHVVYERSAGDDGDPAAPIRQYLSMLKTDRSCLPHFLCEFWKPRSMKEETFLDIVMLTTVEWNGLAKSAAIYDQLKQPDSSAAERFCAQARSECI